MPKPTIGRTVIYNTTERDRKMMEYFGNAPAQLPATVVSVWSDTCVNLKVHCDGPQDMWKTSVSEGTEEYSWQWPKID